MINILHECSTFLTIDEWIWYTLNNWSPPFTLGSIFVLHHFASLNKCVVSCIYKSSIRKKKKKKSSIIQNNLLPWKILCAPLIHPFLSSSPHQLTFFFFFKAISIVLPFPECHVAGITLYVAFSDWLLSLSNVQLRFLHVCLKPNSSFVFIIE